MKHKRNFYLLIAYFYSIRKFAEIKPIKLASEELITLNCAFDENFNQLTKKEFSHFV